MPDSTLPGTARTTTTSRYALVALSIALAILGWHLSPGQSASDGKTSTDSPRATRPNVIALIDRLTEVGEEGVGSHSGAWVDGFIATEEEPRFAGGILGSHRPVTHSAMRDLVRLGVAALPDLLDHLTDARETRLVVGDSKRFFGAIWHSDEYSPRHRDPRRQPPNVNSPQEDFADRKRVGQYTLRVGDLCYVAVGQIVNRGLMAVRYQPTLCMVINSPVHNLALADAARKDWSGLTPREHREELVRDALRKPFGAPAALRRLYFYYPDAAELLAKRLLARPWYDDLKLWKFIEQRLVKGEGPEEWRRLIARYTAENGRAAGEAMPYLVHWVYWETSSTHDREFLEGKDAAGRILAALYPGYDPHSPSFINAAQTREQTDLIEGLAGVRSDRLDRAVAAVFRSMDPARHEGFDRVIADDLALACMDRLIGKGMDAEFESYCERRIAELKQRDREIAENQRLEFLGERLRRIREGMS
jgi:hypothetical protein